MYCPYFVRAKISADYATHVSYNFFLKKERKKGRNKEGKKEKRKIERKKERYGRKKDRQNEKYIQIIKQFNFGFHIYYSCSYVIIMKIILTYCLISFHIQFN